MGCRIWGCELQPHAHTPKSGTFSGDSQRTVILTIAVFVSMIFIKGYLLRQAANPAGA